MVEDLKADYDFFIESLPDFMRNHPGEFVLIFKKEVIGFFDNQLAAISEGERRFGRISKFLVQQCVESRTEFVLSIPYGEEEDFLI